MGKSPKTYIEIQAEIERLSAEAEKAKAREKNEVIARMCVAIDAYGITAADLGLTTSTSRRSGQSRKMVAAAPARKASGKESKPAPAKLPPKYADGKGNQWTGRGSRPKWFLAALDEGRTEADLLLK